MLKLITNSSMPGNLLPHVVLRAGKFAVLFSSVGISLQLMQMVAQTPLSVYGIQTTKKRLRPELSRTVSIPFILKPLSCCMIWLT